jgi:phosphoribosylformylglycinamidine cyclo-ligase
VSANARYREAGVDYDKLDSAKRIAMAAAHATIAQKKGEESRPKDDRRYHAVTDSHSVDVEAELRSQGQSAFVFKANGLTLASVLECVGTKSVIARAYLDGGGANCFASIGIDGVAAAVNDLVSVGALPLVVHAYFATAESTWYDDEDRFEQLVEGWREGCEMSGAVWGGGESPTLAGLVVPGEIEIASSAVGFIPHGSEPILGEALEVGDEIVLIGSSGLHANGATLAREVSSQLPEGWRTLLPSGEEFGAAVLRPALIYSGLVSELQKQKVAVTYCSHITGHGLRKLMRAHQQLTYMIRELPAVPEVLSFIRDQSGMTVYDAYGTLNMGAGFAVYCRAGDGERVVEIAQECQLTGLVAGEVQVGPRQVILEPLGVTFGDDELRLRHG